MKAIAMIFALLAAPLMASELENEVCAEFARGAAEGIYLTAATGIQGHEYESYVTGHELLNDDQAAIEIQISASNDEGDGWTTSISFVVNTNYCSIVEISELVVLE